MSILTLEPLVPLHRRNLAIRAVPAPAAATGRPSLRRLWTLVLLATALAATRAQAQSHTPAQDTSSITLRAAARLAADRALTLADVADLSGPDAQALATVQVAPAGPRPTLVSLEQVRTALDKARANLGRLAIRGSSCTVREPIVMPEPAQAPAAGPPAGTQTLRQYAAERLAQTLDVTPADLRLTWADADNALLNTPTTGRTVALQPTGTGDRVPFSVRIYEHDRIVASGNIRIGVEVRRTVLVATSPMSRGLTLTPDMTTQEERWLPPSAEPADAARSFGLVLRSRVTAGQMLTASDVQPPILVNRGDVVAIDCLSGGFSVRTTARALDVGREGDVILFQSLTSKHTFRARVSGAGLAVTLAPGQQPAAPTGAKK